MRYLIILLQRVLFLQAGLSVMDISMIHSVLKQPNRIKMIIYSSALIIRYSKRYLSFRRISEGLPVI